MILLFLKKIQILSRKNNYFFLTVLFSPSILFAQNICFPEDWQLVKDNNPPHTIVVACYNIAGCYMEKQKFDSVFYFLRKGEKVALKAKDQEGLGMIYLRIAETHTILANYSESLNEIKKANNIFTKLKFSRGEVTAMVALSDVYMRLGDFESVIKIYPTAVYLAKKINSPNEIKMHSFLAEIFLTPPKTNIDSLIYYANLFKNAAISFKATTSIIDADNYLGNAFVLKKQFDKGEKIFFKSLKDAKKEESNRIYEMIYLNLTNLYLLKGQTKKAEKYFQEARKNKEILIRNGHEKAFLLMQSKIDSVKGDFKNAFINFQKFYDFEKKQEYKKIQSKLLNLQSSLDYSVTKKTNKELYNETLQKANQLLKQRVYLILSLISLLFISLALWQYFQNKTKKRELIFAKTNLENELRLIKNQLSPHFVQNAFNTLSLNLPDSSSGQKNKEYLRQLSTYFRRVLDITFKDSHTLEAELEFSEEYLKLQQQIVANKFDYSIAIDDNFDTYSINVPTMLLQPYLENCIKHGFEGLAYQGEIKINCIVENERPVLEIIDNGKGLHNEVSITAGFGSNISKKRLEYFLGSTHNLVEINNLTSTHGCIVRLKLK